MMAALLGEGGSDRALLPILRWLVGQATTEEVTLEWVDTTRFVGGKGLGERARAALVVSPCDLLFIHRDTDGQPPDWRYDEIAQARVERPHIGVVPVRMTEAWLLIEAAAILAAAGRPTAKVKLPALRSLEALSDPKATLHASLREASGASGRRARRFDVEAAVHRVADLVEDWSPLRQLPAFQRLETDTREVFRALGCPVSP